MSPQFLSLYLKDIFKWRIGSKQQRKNSFLKWYNPGLCFVYFRSFKYKIFHGKCRCQRDLNSDGQGRKQAHLPLGHQHGTEKRILNIFKISSLCSNKSHRLERRLEFAGRITYFQPGASPIKNLQHKFYAMLIFKHPDWLINLSSQSECLKNCIALNLCCKIFIGLVPECIISDYVTQLLNAETLFLLNQF